MTAQIDVIDAVSGSAPDIVLEARGLVRAFGGVKAVDGLDINLREGGITGLIGPNGAGKSTTLKSISGLIKPERGVVTRGSIDFQGERIDRKDPAAIAHLRARYRGEVSYASQQFGHFNFFAQIGVDLYNAIRATTNHVTT